jgi:hypothetical protein
MVTNAGNWLKMQRLPSLLAFAREYKLVRTVFGWGLSQVKSEVFYGLAILTQTLSGIPNLMGDCLIGSKKARVQPAAREVAAARPERSVGK